MNNRYPEPNELAELYDSLSALYNHIPSAASVEWKRAVSSVLFGGEFLEDGATCYGKQQSVRNSFKMTEYRSVYGTDGRVTEFSVIDVAPPRERDLQYTSREMRIPVAPRSGVALPIYVPESELSDALSLLSELPGEPLAEWPLSGHPMRIDPQYLSMRTQESGQLEDESFTLLFVSDTHLGYENRVHTDSGKVVPWVDQISTTTAFDEIVELAATISADAVVHTGDILDHEVDQLTLTTIRDSLCWLSEWEIPFYFVLGSHDQQSAHPRWESSVNGIDWLKQLEYLEVAFELTSDPTYVPGTDICLYGVSAGNIGVSDIGSFKSTKWHPSEISFTPNNAQSAVLCLHDSVTPYRNQSTGALDIDDLLTHSSVSFDLILIGDEHRPMDDDFADGYFFSATDGTPILYTGPASRIGPAYSDERAFVTELTFRVNEIHQKRHYLSL